MNKAFAVIGLCLALSGVAFAQQKSAKEEIVGAWTLVSVTSEMDDGNKGEPFGPSPKGVIIFSNDGYFSLFQSRAEIPKIAANDRAKATPEEAQSIVASSIAYYGTYSIDEKTKVMLGPNRYLRARKDLEPVQRKLFRDVILHITDEDHRISDCTGFIIRNR